MKALVIAEFFQHKFSIINQHTLSAVKKLSDEVDLLLPEKTAEDDLQKIQSICQIQNIYMLPTHNPANKLPENLAPLIATFAKNYEVILMAATTFGKNILPRVSALLDVAMIGDIIQIISHDTFVRPIYAGNARETIRLNEKIKLLTIRTTAFLPLLENIFYPSNIQILPEINLNPTVSYLSEETHPTTRPNLTSAKIIVAGGRGFKTAENFHLLEKLADTLGAAVGASRAAVDAGFAPNDWQIGQTGKIVGPELYIAIGISGAIQHVAGIKDSKIIVAINSDPEAAIFQFSDFYLVGDLFTILSELQLLISPKK